MRTEAHSWGQTLLALRLAAFWAIGRSRDSKSFGANADGQHDWDNSACVAGSTQALSWAATTAESPLLMLAAWSNGREGDGA